MTCRHFRNQVPREYADELRDADPEPCEVCDALPHRKAQAASCFAPVPIQYHSLPHVDKPGWPSRSFGQRTGDVLPERGLAVAARVAA
jgi:hypothetical protein